MVALLALAAINACGSDESTGALPSDGNAGGGGLQRALSGSAPWGSLQHAAIYLRATRIAAVQRHAPEHYDFEVAEQRAISHNATHGLRSAYTADGMQIRPDHPSCGRSDGDDGAEVADEACWTVVLRLAAVRHGGREIALRAGSAPEAVANSAHLRQGDQLEEWYLNGPLGLEHGFVLDGPPAGPEAEGHGDIVLEIEVAGDLEPQQVAQDAAIALRGHDGQSALYYTDLLARDAADRLLPASMNVEDGAIRIRVDARGAVYPLTIDPLLWTETRKLVASVPEDDAELGTAVAVSGDIAIVGAWNESSAGTARGAVYIFYRDQGGPDMWGQVAVLAATDAADFDHFGQAVDIWNDVAIVGAPGTDDGGTDRGAAYVFYRDQGGPDTWGQVAKLSAGDAQNLDQLGAAVAIDGATAIVGASGEDGAGSDRGAAYVFYRDQGGSDLWGQVVKLTPGDTQNFDLFGCAVDLSGDIAVIGSAGDNSAGQGTGAAYVLYRDFGGNDAWGEVRKLVASDKAGGDAFGSAVSVFGATAVVGAPFEDGPGADRGAAYVFEQDWGSPDGWGEVRKLVAADAQNLDRLGASVAISNDTAFVGAPSEDGPGTDRGAAYVFERDAGSQDNWGQTVKLQAADAANGDFFGQAVSLSGGSGVGDAAIVGAPLEDGSGNARGAAYVFMLNKTAGEPCLVGDECVSGFCVDMVCCDSACGGGALGDCIACSVGAGAPLNGVCWARFNGSLCGDGEYCNGTETCNAGICGSSTGDPCAGHVGDADANCSESCDEATQSCSATDPDGAACSDGTFCNGAESCTAGACGDSAGDPCTGNLGDTDADCSESCNEGADACTANDPDGSSCDDALFCNGADLCLGGVCLTHAGDPCPGADGDVDCSETCDESADSCEAHDPNGAPCPGGVCDVGSCETGNGGAGGSSSSSGSGGNGGGSSSSGSGGSSSSGSGGSSSSGSGGSGGNSSSGTGGSGGDGGSAVTSSGTGSLGAGGGCGCRVAPDRSAPLGWGAGALVMALALARRRNKMGSKP